MSRRPLASIIITSYNYGRFLNATIESALGQAYPHTEVIVVDDGSTDSSRDIIAGYGSRITPLLKDNGGQASAFNAGFQRSRGDVIVFLDSDDLLLPTALEKAVPLFASGDVAKVHWPLWVIDAGGRKNGEKLPHEPLAEGDLRAVVLGAAADGYTWPPTSGNCWSRAVLEAIGPLPEEPFRTCPDYYLSALAPLYGLVKRIPEPQSFYRDHGANHGRRAPLEQRLEMLRRLEEHNLEALSRHCRALGLRLDVPSCRSSSWSRWLEQVYLATQDIATLLTADTRYILVDEAKWQLHPRDLTLPGRPIPFPEQDGEYAGPPADDDSAVSELERLRQLGAQLVVFAAPAFWWLDYYTGLAEHLRSSFPCLLRNERVVIYDLRQATPRREEGRLASITAAQRRGTT